MSTRASALPKEALTIGGTTCWPRRQHCPRSRGPSRAGGGQGWAAAARLDREGWSRRDGVLLLLSRLSPEQQQNTPASPPAAGTAVVRAESTLCRASAAPHPSWAVPVPRCSALRGHQRSVSSRRAPPRPPALPRGRSPARRSYPLSLNSIHRSVRV